MRVAFSITIAVALVLATGASFLVAAQDSRPTSRPEPKSDSSAAAQHENLKKPKAATEKAPASFRVRFQTTQGDFDVEVNRAWAPNGADRFYNLVRVGYYQDVAFFRVIAGFMAQFGLHGDASVTAAWRGARIKDDPVTQSNTRGMITFATAGPNTRTTQLFINYGNNARLDSMGFAPFGKVMGEGMKVVDKLYSGYGEGAPKGRGPSQGAITSQGSKYLKASFPKLDYIKNIQLIKPSK